MVSLRGEEIVTVKITDAIEEIKKVNPEGDLVRAARAVGISMGDKL